MPLRYLGISVLMAAVSLSACKPRDTQPHESASAMSRKVADVSCPKAVPEAFRGALNVQSKYDQSDKSKSTLLAKRDDESEEIQSQIQEYAKGVVRLADYAVSDASDRKAQQAEACLTQWLDAWANDHALETDDTSKTGQAVRKWTLATLAMVALKTEALTNGQWQASTTTRNWFNRLGRQVMTDYSPRLDPGFKYFNNHDHWAAWSVFSSGLLSNDKEMMAWGYKVFSLALDKAVFDKRHQYAYFPNELARKHLATNYTHFSLTPLVMLARYLPNAGYPLSSDQSGTLIALANFASVAVTDPGSLKSYLGDKQSPVAGYKLAWTQVFLSMHPDNKPVRALYDSEKGDVDGYSQLGGKLSQLYPVEGSK
ncbi:MAG: alginate lyase family protein [Hahellaceae bacterium]|nr:alginate lyase family protein [Hahellaceae bacterium]MCP5168942.1 alginate lyase family protein [Hahellaceae bacterium]